MSEWDRRDWHDSSTADDLWSKLGVSPAGVHPPPSASTYSYSYSCEPMGDASAEPEHLCAQPAPRAQQR